MDTSLSKLRKVVKEREAWRAAVYGSARVRHDLVTELRTVLPIRNAEGAFGLPRWLSGKESPCQCRKTWVQSLSQQDPLKKEMATQPSILAW